MLTVNLLSDCFVRYGIKDSAYAFYSLKEDAFSVIKCGSHWKVVYVERGVPRTLAIGENESQALNLLWLFVMESERGFK